METILIVDDDEDILESLKIFLTKEDYRLLTAKCGKEAVECVRREHIDLVLMDIMMPVMDWIKATQLIRQITNIPIILLSAKSEDVDKINGLNIGADDYITKPFYLDVVVAHIKAQLRRYKHLGDVNKHTKLIILGGLTLDDTAKKVSVEGQPVSLTPMEFGILKMLMRQPGKVFTSSEIYKNVWAW